MLLGMQDFDFCPNLIITFAQISSQFCPNIITFSQILPKLRQILTKFAHI